jgi:hypothetical protein
MKKILFIIFILSIKINAQNNIINYDDLKINTTSLETLSKNSILSSLGFSSNATNYVSEMTNESFLKYSLNNNFILFENEKMVGFSLDDATFYFINPNIKVGNNINSIATIYPLSFNNRELINNLGFIIINLSLGDNSPSDEFVVINYDTSGVIRSIHLGEY